MTDAEHRGLATLQRGVQTVLAEWSRWSAGMAEWDAEAAGAEALALARAAGGSATRVVVAASPLSAELALAMLHRDGELEAKLRARIRKGNPVGADGIETAAREAVAGLRRAPEPLPRYRPAWDLGDPTFRPKAARRDDGRLPAWADGAWRTRVHVALEAVNWSPDLVYLRGPYRRLEREDVGELALALAAAAALPPEHAAVPQVVGALGSWAFSVRDPFPNPAAPRDRRTAAQQRAARVYAAAIDEAVLGKRHAAEGPRRVEALPTLAELAARRVRLFANGARIAVRGNAVLVAAPPVRIAAAATPEDRAPRAAFADGWNVWTLGGVLVDEALAVRPETQTTREIDDERNEEVRRLRIERFAGAQRPRAEGWLRYLAAVGAMLLDERRNDVEGTREALYRTARGDRLLVCHCPSTARMYALELPRDVASCTAAQTWLWSGSTLADLRGRPFNIIGRT